MSQSKLLFPAFLLYVALVPAHAFANPSVTNLASLPRFHGKTLVLDDGRILIYGGNSAVVENGV